MKLKYNNRALYKLEQQCGMKIHKISPEDLGFSDLINLIWAGLLYKEPNLTIDEVLDRYDDILEAPEKYADAINDAFDEAFPKAETEKN